MRCGTNKNMLEARNVHKIYRQANQDVHVLRGIDLKINEGAVLSIVGPSGAGKTTLLHILGGLDKPTEGEVIFENQEIYGLSDRERAEIRNKKAGFVFQFYHLLPEFTALENVTLPGWIKGGEEPRALERKGMNLLEKFGLKHRRSHKPHQLSGGEQQRVAIARSLMNDPDIIFCDEPTGNLDSKTGEEIVQVIMELNRTQKKTLVIVTHDENIAKRSHRIVHIRDGKLEK